MQVFTYICQNFKTMKANELRLGNLIDRQDYICKVTRIEEDGIITEPLEYKGERFVEQKLKPIPLTEEWLVKFGFKKTLWNNTNYPNRFELTLYVNGILIKYDSYYNETTALSFGEFGNDNVIITKLKYVHQLQNLYFALTGEELTIG